MSFKEPRPFEVPILLLVFNRPKCTSRLIELIESMHVAKLYVSADGPRKGVEADRENCKQVRALIRNCRDVVPERLRFHDENVGCKLGPASGIDWFFQHEEQGIILEDDCLPSPEFFEFCREMLARYQDDESVYAVSGNNFQNGKKRGDGSYYFSKYVHVWGWATWRRAWAKNDLEMRFWPEFRASRQWDQLHPVPREREFWEELLDRVATKRLNTCWDYQWLASIWAQGGKAIVPNVNMVTNVGFGPSATHTKDLRSPFAKLPTQHIGLIKHPSSEEVCTRADRYVFSRNYHPDFWQRMLRKWRKLKHRFWE